MQCLSPETDARNIISSPHGYFQVTHLVISKPTHFKYSAGDYVFLQIPDLAAFEWHPFSISSAPEEGNVFDVYPHLTSFNTSLNMCWKLKSTIMSSERWMSFSTDNACLYSCEFIKTYKSLLGELWLHIRSLGNWTDRLYDFYKHGKYNKCNQVAPFKILENADLEANSNFPKRTSKREMMRPRDVRNTIQDHRKVWKLVFDALRISLWVSITCLSLHQ